MHLLSCDFSFRKNVGGGTIKKVVFIFFVFHFSAICNIALGDIDSGLVSYYNFESLSGTDGEIVTDQSGNGHNGICKQDILTTKIPTIVPGPDGLGDALSFDGNFYIEIANHPDFDITQNITIASWVKVDVFDTEWQTVFCRGDWSWRIARNGSSDSACFHLSGFGSIYGSSGQININDGNWHHIVGTWSDSGNPTELWIDGIKDSANDDILNGVINTSGNDPVTIGAQIHEGTLRRQWKGCIDEVRLYNRVLSDNEVEELYMFSSQDNWNAIPSVTLPAYKYISLESDSIELTLEGEISDDGNPLPENPDNPNPNDPNKLRWWWQVITKPSEAAEPVLKSPDQNDIAGSEFVYDNPNQKIIVEPNVVLTQPGYYEFRLYASDGQKTNHATCGIAIYPANSSGYEYREQGYLYLSPLPGAEYVSRKTKYILIRFVDISPYDITNLSKFVTIHALNSGYHSGNTKIASDETTVIFELDSTFSDNELVSVLLDPIVEPNASNINSYEYQFMTTGSFIYASEAISNEELYINESLDQADTLFSANVENEDVFTENKLSNQLFSGTATNTPMIMPNGVSVPSNFPYINITINDNPDSGYIFLDNRTSGSNSYNVIFDNDGNPVWYWQKDDERRDMKVQSNGVLTMLARDGKMRFIGLDNNYKQVAEYSAVNGASTDEHELVIREDGYYFLFGLRSETVDMRMYVPSGKANANVAQTMIQEFTPEGDLIFQWRAWDHLDIRDVHLDNISGSSIRFPHMNAIDFDDDGQILLSCRHLSEIIKIDIHTGEIIWRLGGNHSDYAFINDPLNGFRNQHSIRALGNRRYLLFDNGDLHSPSVSRAVEYELDPNEMTATIVWQYPETTTTSLYSHYMGNTQRLENGNTLINWAVGHLPKLTEVRPDGTKAFEMNWVDGYEAYRVWRCQWQGISKEPALQIEQTSDYIALLFNKFGDPNVDYYKVYGGKSPEPTTLWTVSDSSLAYLTDFESSGRYYFRVTAVDVNGFESGYSNEESISVSVSQPGVNIVQNGDFSNGLDGWIWENPASPASADYEINEGQFHYIISDGGSDWSSIQLRQIGINLIRGKEYIFEFDTWADSPRIIEAKVGQDVSPWTNYSKIGPTYITTQKNHYTYTFTMEEPSDSNARVVINTGRYNIDVYIDNISLKETE